MANGHGGAREGAGRKPKTLRYQEEVSAVERKIVGMLPRLVDKLYEMAMDGDIRANRYLIERIMGRIPVLEAAPSVDSALPYTERDFTVETLGHNLNLCDEEALLNQRIEDMFVYAGDDDEEQTSGDIIPESTDQTDVTLRAEPAQHAAVDSTPSLTPLLGSDAVRPGAAPAVDAITVPFMPSDGPDDPTWYFPDATSAAFHRNGRHQTPIPGYDDRLAHNNGTCVCPT